MFSNKVTPIIIILLSLTCLPFVMHNSLTDRINPTVSETVSYATVPKNTQKYYYVQAFNPQNGKDLPYRIRYVGGYDPTGKYISIDHRGQYVKEIKYITKKEFLTAKRKN